MIVIRIKFLVGTRSALKGEWKMRNTIMLMAAISLLELSVRRGSKTFYFLVYGNWGKVFKAFVVWMRVVYGLSGHNSFEIRPHSQAHLGTRKTSFICQLQLMRFSHKLSSLFCFLWVCVCEALLDLTNFSATSLSRFCYYCFGKAVAKIGSS